MYRLSNGISLIDRVNPKKREKTGAVQNTTQTRSQGTSENSEKNLTDRIKDSQRWKAENSSTGTV